MSTLAGFFKGSDTRFGIFYPHKYLIAVFSEFEPAKQAEQTLRYAGFADDDVIAVPGEDVVHLAQEHLKGKGLWVLLTQELSRVIGTEEAYTDKDLGLARQGAGFVAVYCPTEADKRRAWNVLESLSPLVARHYSLAGIDHLAGES